MSRPLHAIKRPGLKTALFLGLLTFLLGGLLGTLSLITQSVEEMRELPDPVNRVKGAVYLVKGAEEPGARWRRKRNQIQRGEIGEVRFTESDLNDWAKNSFTPQLLRPPEGAEEVATPPAPETDEITEEGEESATEGLESKGRELLDRSKGFFRVAVNPAPPNFRFVNGQLQISTTLEFPTFGSRRYIYQVTGEFALDENDVLQFVPIKGTLGRAPLVNVPFAGKAFQRWVTGLFSGAPETAEMLQHWGKFRAIRIEGGELIVEVR